MERTELIIAVLMKFVSVNQMCQIHQMPYMWLTSKRCVQKVREKFIKCISCSLIKIIPRLVEEWCLKLCISFFYIIFTADPCVDYCWNFGKCTLLWDGKKYNPRCECAPPYGGEKCDIQPCK